jgi:hypothetical protein
MAFGSGLSGGRDRLAARLKITADTGQAKTEVTELGRQFESVMKGMTAEQVKLDRAAKHFQDTLKTYGAEHSRTKNAALRLASAEKTLNASLGRTETQMNRTGHAAQRAGHNFDGAQRSFSRMTRGAIAGSGVFQALGRTMAFASAGFIGTTGFVYGAKAAVSAASDLEEQVNKTKEVFQGSSGAVIAFSKNALGLSQRQALQTSSTIGALIHAMGVVGPTATKASVDLTKLGVDLASFYNTSVEDSLAALQSALVGQVRPLRRYGAEVSAAREKTVALAMTGKTSATELTRQERVMARLAIIFKDTKVAQGDYLRTSDGLANQQRTLSGNIEDMAAMIGKELIPATTDATKQLNKWLENSKNQEKVQKTVNSAVRVGGKIMHDFGAALSIVNRALEPLVDALGGTKNAIELAFGAAAVLKVRGWATSMGWIGTSAATAATEVVAAAGRMEAALDTATRPRTAVVTVVTEGVPAVVPGGGGGKTSGKRSVVDRIGDYGKPIAGGTAAGVAATAKAAGYRLGMNPFTAVLTAVLLSGGDSATGGYKSAKKAYPRITELLQRVGRGGPLTDTEREALAQMPQGKSVSQLSVAQLQKLERLLRATTLGPPVPTKKDTAAAAARQQGTPAAAAARRRAAKIKRAEGRIARFEVDAKAAERDESLGNDIVIAKKIAAQRKIILNLKKGDLQAAGEYEDALNDVYRLEQQQAQQKKQATDAAIASRNAKKAAAKARAQAIRQAHLDSLATTKQTLEAAVASATTAKGLRSAQARYVAFLKKETKDAGLLPKERAHYVKLLIAARQKGVKDELALREQLLKNSVARAEGTESKTDDVTAEKNLIAFYRNMAKRKDQTAKEAANWIKKALKAEKDLAGLVKKERTEAKRGLVWDFLEKRADFFSSFAPNTFIASGSGSNVTRTPGSTAAGSAGRTVIVNQNFTSSPTNVARQATMAYRHFGAQEDG